MKQILFMLSLALALILGTNAQASGVANAPFQEVIYLKSGPIGATSSASSGKDYVSAKGLVTGTIFTPPAGVVIEDVYAIVDTALVGPTALIIGDASDGGIGGFITTSASTLWQTTGIKNASLGEQGIYLRSTSGNLAGVASKTKKYYSSATGITMTVTGSATAGKVRVIFKGFVADPHN